jgi:hypothetical protein
METRKLVIAIEFTEAEAAALDRYIEEGCHDRDKLIKRQILTMIAAPAATWNPAYPAARVTSTGVCPDGATWATSGYLDVINDRIGRVNREDHRHPKPDKPLASRSNHRHPVCQNCARKSDYDDFLRALELSERRSAQGLPSDPALLM